MRARDCRRLLHAGVDGRRPPDGQCGATPAGERDPRLPQHDAILGAAGGGLLVAGPGPGLALAVDAATYVVGACFLAFLRLPPMPAARRHFARELREGWAEFRGRRWLWAVVVQFTFINAFSWAAFFVLGPFVAASSLGGAAAWGLILTAEAAGCSSAGTSRSGTGRAGRCSPATRR